MDTHTKQTMTILGGVITILLAAVTVIDNTDAFGIKQINSSIKNHESRISGNEIIVEKHKVIIDHLRDDLNVIRADTAWIKNYLINNP